MILWKIWFDVRNRFYLTLTLTLLLAFSMVNLFVLGSKLLPVIKPDMPVEQMEQIKQLGRTYRLFQDEGWFQEIQFISGFAAFLALGGILSERKTGTHLLTLALPVSRRRWIVCQAVFVALLSLSLTVAASLVILVGGWIAGAWFPLHRAAMGVVAVLLRSLPWIAAALAALAIFESRWKAAIALILYLFVIDILGLRESLREWFPVALLHSLDSNSAWWKPLLSILVSTFVFGWIAVRTFEARDF